MAAGWVVSAAALLLVVATSTATLTEGEARVYRVAVELRAQRDLARLERDAAIETSDDLTRRLALCQEDRLRLSVELDEARAEAGPPWWVPWAVGAAAVLGVSLGVVVGGAAP